MIIFLREKFIAQIFMWVIAIVFVVGSILLYSGSGGQGDGTEEEVVLKIQSLEVSRGNFEKMVSDQLQSRRNQQYGGEPDEKNIQNEIIDFLVRRAIEGSAKISDAEVERYIRSDSGRVQTYNQYEGFGVAELYKQNIRQQLSSTLLRDNIQGLELVTDIEAEQAFRLESEKAKVKYIEFRHSDYTSNVKVDDAEAEQYFQENKVKYKNEEQINVKFIRVNPEEFVTQTDIENYYTQNQSEFTTPEVVKARHILKNLPNDATDEEKAEIKTAAEELLKTVNAELASGASFADLAKTHSEGPSGANGGALRGGNPNLPPGDYFARGDMVKPFEETCFDVLQPGEVSGLVETSFGYHIIKLEEKLQGSIKPFPEVENEIRGKVVKVVGVDKAKRVADDLLFDIEVEDFETAIGLETYKDLSLNVSETGFFEKDVVSIPIIGSKWNNQGLLEGLYDMEVGVINTIESKKYNGDVTGFYVAKILGKKPAAIPSFDDVKNQVIDDLRDIKAEELAMAAAQELVKQKADGESLDDLIKKYTVPEGESSDQKTVQESNLFNLTPGSSYVSGMGNSKEVMFAAFNMSVGDVKGPLAGDSSSYIIELTERVEADIELFAKDPTQKKERLKSLLQTKKQQAYDNWFASQKMIAKPWIHEDYR
ncbi:peptidyl-prolyl cis-trans isomerase [Candidatus Poribacteria bacterium]|nr:peptidyl-prolyl cis-trans isomerase [Candidatus Poribacteria bacterium]